jgi:hypothetical protein
MEAISVDEMTEGEPGAGPDARGSLRTQAVASLAIVLAEAVLAGDHERARALAEELREFAAPTTVPRSRRVR